MLRPRTGSKELRFAALAAAPFLFLLAAHQDQAEAESIEIMPLGDSITHGSDGHASYRYWLDHALHGASIPFDFVGSVTGVHNGYPPYEDYDQDHEGHWGWRVDQILEHIAGWTGAYAPKIVLIHLGHNDLWQNESLESTVEELGALVDTIRSIRPSIAICLAQIIPASPLFGGPGLRRIPEFNALLPALVAGRQMEGSPLVLVDQYTGFDPLVDTYDGVHPDESGEIKLADRWMEALLPLLSHPSAATEAQATSPLSRPLRLTVFPNPVLVGPDAAGSDLDVTVTYELDRPAEVRLSIHDVTGREAFALGRGLEERGAHVIRLGRSIQMSGASARGVRRTASGGSPPAISRVFYVRVQAGDIEASTRLLKFRQ